MLLQHPVFEYDMYRLETYKQRKRNIAINNYKGYLSLMFEEVDYFNYLYLNTNNISIKKLGLPYYEKGIDRIKIIQSKESYYHHDFLDLSYQDRTIVACYKDLSTYIPSSNITTIKPVSNDEDLLHFTKLYLTVFGSSNKDYDEVAENFKLLLQSKQSDLFFIQENGNTIGICSNFYNEEYMFLASCGVLPEYQNRGFQKKAIKERLSIGKQKGYKSCYVWAYDNTISLSNLLKSGLSIHKTYHEGLSKPLGDLIKQQEILQA
ncbi:GNAT family N-acetyltransferase [Flammeovirga sp. SubArs3]|uniref:GNAT family N-acetyltransferase n=1 Tax=Flammeovirga sp. SubArs3 TaxID=2995316 RepID=UPI00248CEEFF|nr:GNAT family N-acetyltransferase [Flammeovirga sp. SubArs3]